MRRASRTLTSCVTIYADEACKGNQRRARRRSRGSSKHSKKNRDALKTSGKDRASTVEYRASRRRREERRRSQSGCACARTKPLHERDKAKAEQDMTKLAVEAVTEFQQSMVDQARSGPLSPMRTGLLTAFSNRRSFTRTARLAAIRNGTFVSHEYLSGTEQGALLRWYQRRTRDAVPVQTGDDRRDDAIVGSATKTLVSRSDVLPDCSVRALFTSLSASIRRLYRISGSMLTARTTSTVHHALISRPKP
jgi:hypothetical protein